MRRFIRSESGLVLRGGCAIAFLVLITILMIIDVARGNTEALGTWLSVIGGSVVLSLLAYGWHTLFGTKPQTTETPPASSALVGEPSGRMVCRIGFLGEDEAYVCIESQGIPTRLLPSCEITLFCLYCLRQFCNLGHGAPADFLALTLEGEDLVSNMAQEKKGCAPKLRNAEPGAPKQFVAELNGRRFTVNLQGFGLLGKDLAHYAPASVLAFVQKLSRARAEDEQYLSALATAGQSCASLYREQKLTLRNQQHLAIAVAVMAYDELGKGEAAGAVHPNRTAAVRLRRPAHTKAIPPQIGAIGRWGQKLIAMSIAWATVLWEKYDSTQDMGLFKVTLLELLCFCLHAVDRAAHARLGSQGRDTLLELLHEVMASFLRSTQDSRIQGLDQTILLEWYDARNRQYGLLKPTGQTHNVAETLYCQFVLNVSNALGRSDVKEVITDVDLAIEQLLDGLRIQDNLETVAELLENQD